MARVRVKSVNIVDGKTKVEAEVYDGDTVLGRFEHTFPADATFAEAEVELVEKAGTVPIHAVRLARELKGFDEELPERARR